MPLYKVPFRKFGVEIEFFGPQKDAVEQYLFDIGLAVRGWSIGYDTSIDKYANIEKTKGNADKISEAFSRDLVDDMGLELRSPPLTGEDGLAQLKGAMALLKNLEARYNVTTAFHIHYDASDLSLDDVKKIMVAFLIYEDALEFLLGIDRCRMHENSEYAKSLQRFFADESLQAHAEPMILAREELIERGGSRVDMFMLQAQQGGMSFDAKTRAIQKGVEGIVACQTMEELKNLIRYDRNFKLNLMAYDFHGTLEYRQNGGVELSYEGYRSVIIGFDHFLLMALDGALPVDLSIFSLGTDRKMSILSNIMYADQSPIYGGFCGQPSTPGILKYIRRFKPDFMVEGDMSPAINPE